MKKLFVAGVVLGLGSVATVAFAHAPIITIHPVPDLTYGVFPQTYNVTGVVAHSPIASVKSLTLRVNGIVASSSTDPFALMIGTTSPYSLPWNIVGPRTYTLSVTARHGTTGQTGTSTEEIVDVILDQVVVVTQCPAAPAIAGAYMKETLHLKPGSAKFKEIISAVAHETGKGGSLWAKNACESGYAQSVKTFVDLRL